MLEDLLAQVDYAGETLEDWLRNGFFEQHCALFHHRPFIWHIWDGHKNGFSALVNYHQLTHANLEKLTYAYLGDWIRRQQAAVDAGRGRQRRPPSGRQAIAGHASSSSSKASRPTTSSSAGSRSRSKPSAGIPTSTTACG